MSEYEELMARQAKLIAVWKDRCKVGEQYSVGTLLGRNGELMLPVYEMATGRRVEDLMMRPGDALVSRVWGPGPGESEVLEA